MDTPEIINIKEYEYAGEGANGVSYNHKTDQRFMLKLYNETVPGDFVQRELDRARHVYEMGIPSPKPGVLITDGKRLGIRFERIVNKKSFSRLVGEHPEKVEQYAREFARMCKKLHSTPCDTTIFENVKDAYKRDLELNPFFTAEEKSKIATLIEQTPDALTAIHGDLQFSNAITDGEHNYFIDFGDFAYGNPKFDLGMVLLCCKYDSEEFVQQVFHMSKETASKFWDHFVPEYFGEGTDPDEMDRQLRPYAGLKTLIIERYVGKPMPEFRELLGGMEN